MSVINQVLNQLEQRGVQSAPEQVLIRAIPPRRANKYRWWFALAALLLLALAWAARQWLPRETVSEPVLPAAIAETATAVDASADLPASRLSFELSSLPLPSSLRAPVQAVAPVAVPVPASAVPVTSAKPAPQIATQPAESAAPVKRVSAAQQADAEFRRAAGLMQQGRIADALTGYEAALRLHAGHDAARQALVALLLEQKRAPEAERVLQDGLLTKPEHGGFAMTLARLQVERGALDTAVATLEKSLPHNADRAEYRAFLAALLQRQGRHQETVGHYQVALHALPGNGLWQMGYGISLEALQRREEARAAFKQALASGSLNPELRKFVQQRLK